MNSISYQPTSPHHLHCNTNNNAAGHVDEGPLYSATRRLLKLQKTLDLDPEGMKKLLAEYPLDGSKYAKEIERMLLKVSAPCLLSA